MKDKIVVIGSSNVDLIMKMDHLPAVGETVTDAQFLQVFGGKGADQAVAGARAGGNVAFINCVGEDAYTPQMVQNFKEEGMDIQYVFEEKGNTSGHALIMIGDEGKNYISVAPGANYALTPEKIDKALPVIEEAAIIILQYEILAQTIKYVIDLANNKRIPVLWNFAPARSFDLSYIGKTDIIVVNEVEGEFLSGIEIADIASAEKSASILLGKGSKMVIITLGKEGALVLTDEEKHHIPAFQVDAVDTTSAGDVFCGSFAVAFIEGKPIAQAIEFANAAAALCVTKMGAQPSAPGRQEIDAFLLQQSTA